MRDEPPCFRLIVAPDGTSGIYFGTYTELSKKPFSSLGRGYSTEEELRKEEHVITCSICGCEAGTHFLEPVAKHLREHQRCHTCDFWMEKIGWQEHPDGRHQPVRVGGKHYCYDPRRPVNMDQPKWNGFGGHRWKIGFLDTGVVTETNDLWNQGEIPARFLPRLPENAVFL